MGFLERLRQEISDREARAEKEKLRKQEASRRKWEQERAEQERVDILLNRSLGYYELSRAREFLDQLASVVHGNTHDTAGYGDLEVDNQGRYKRKKIFSLRGGSGSIAKELSWSIEDPPRVYHKTIVVEACPDGRIIFHGGWFGFSATPLDRWEAGDPTQAIERALEKACRHPRVETSWKSSYSPSSTYDRIGH